MDDHENEQNEQLEPGAAGAPEGAVAEPTTADVQSMYDELGIKATAPTGATKGRPKSTAVRAKDVSEDRGDDSDAGKQKGTKVQGKSKDAPDSDADDASGDKADPKGAQKRSTDGKVQGESDEAGDGVRKAESTPKEDSERGDEDGSEQRDNRPGQEAHESNDTPEEGEDAEGKRPGKSNPGVERRFQQLTAEKRAAEEQMEQLRQQLEEATRQQYQAKIDQEDPEYTVEDFRKVRDENGVIHDLDEDRAELAYRRWKDGYEQRRAERDARYNQEQALAQAQQEYAERTMRESVEAHDTLTSLISTYPELDARSDKFDQAFSDKVVPLIEKMVIYQEGTEPGNENGYQPVIAGMKMNPKDILDVINEIKSAKRDLPLNGLNDTVESRSNVNVPHSRSSDPTVNAANELYKSLNINKRI